MSTLTEYNKKRNLQRTPEPKATIKTSDSNQPIFSIQKHSASNLHYDLRLEHDGVLKSWAIPKGLPLATIDKHLAIMVEDHPYDYWNFEGEIPEGSYGAGKVMVWDCGHYQMINSRDKLDSEQKFEEGLKKGHLSIILSGKKLCGEFALVKFKKKEKNEWLIIKKNDECANKPVDEIHSALSGKTIEDIGNDNDVEIDKILTKAPKSKMLQIKPTLAKTAPEPFSNKEWIYEIKWDGYRAISYITDDQKNLISRNQINFNNKFPKIAKELDLFSKNCILDGEIVVVDKEGKPVFSELQNSKSIDQSRIFYYVFDLLYFDEKLLLSLPLIDRKKILKKILPKTLSQIRFSDHIVEKGIEFFKTAKQQGLEGIMAKKCMSSYEVGTRTSNWLKIKNIQTQEAIICGYTISSKQIGIGALILGAYRNNEIIYIGHTGSGFSSKFLSELRIRLDKIKSIRSSFKILPKTNDPAVWVKPLIVCQIKFTEWTKDNVLRHPVFMGIREDLDASQVVI